MHVGVGGGLNGVPAELLEPGLAAGAVSSLSIAVCAKAAACGELNVAPGIPGTVYTVFEGAELWLEAVPPAVVMPAFPAATSGWCDNVSPASSPSASAPVGDASRTLES